MVTIKIVRAAINPHTGLPGDYFVNFYANGRQLNKRTGRANTRFFTHCVEAWEFADYWLQLYKVLDVEAKISL